MRNEGLTEDEIAHSFAASAFVIEPFSKRRHVPTAPTGNPHISPESKTDTHDLGRPNNRSDGINLYTGLNKSDETIRDAITMYGKRGGMTFLYAIIRESRTVSDMMSLKTRNMINADKIAQKLM